MLHFQRWKLILVFGIVVAGILFALPNVFPAATMARMPSWLPHKQVNLGLDLQGGAHLLYQLDEKEMAEDWLNTIRGDVRETLRRAHVGYTDLTQDAATRSVSVKIRDAAEMDNAYTELKKLAQPVGGSVFAGFSGYDIDVARQGDNAVSLTLTDVGMTHRMGSAIQASIETIRRRVDAFGTTEPSIQREGRDRVLVQVPGISDVERLKKLIGETGKLEFKLVDPSANAVQVAETKQIPPGDELVYSAGAPKGSPEGTAPIPYVLKSQVLVSGASLVDAQPGFDSRSGEPVVTFRFDAAGATRFGKVTQENVGLPFAIVLDNKVISAPVIREPILGGTGQISGNFTVQQANDLSVLLRSGSLPAKLTVIEERTVGASLGADSIASGKKAALMGLALVMIFMLVGYGLFGLFANLALLINIALIFGVLSLMGATLTLPGIAGIVLTIGIAVDANVLINERIREEIRQGKSPFAAVDTGYSRALITIVDSNVTTLIAVLVLFWLGSGPVRGFAVTLTVGIIASMFTAVTVTRLMVAYWLRRTRPQLIPI
jgi:protein-export membrane protein SecD